MDVSNSPDLLIEELDSEVLVYDSRTDRAHCLNECAARVLRAYDPKATLAEISQRLTAEHGPSYDEDTVELALRRLAEAALIRMPEAKQRAEPATNRRRFLGALLVPVVTSIIAPTAAQAASCVGLGLVVALNQNCCPGLIEVNSMVLGVKICVSIGMPMQRARPEDIWNQGPRRAPRSPTEDSHTEVTDFFKDVFGAGDGF